MEFLLTSTLLATVLLLIFGHFLTHSSKRGKAINKIPGPKSLPIIGNTLDICIPLEALWIWLRKHATEYYPIYKVWIAHRAVIVMRHPDDAEALLSSQQNISKSTFYDFLHPWLEEGLLTSTGNKWRGRRKILTPAFHFNMLQEFIGAFVENSERMVKALRAERGEVVKDLVPFLAKFTLSAICETAMGTTLQDKDPVQDEYRNSVKTMGDILFYRAVRPWYYSNWIFSLSQKGQEQKKALTTLHNFTTKIIDERKAYHEKTGGKYIGHISSKNEASEAADVQSRNKKIQDYLVNKNDAIFDIAKKKRLAMLDLLIAVQKDNRETIDNRGIREEVDTFIFEGHDTTVMGLSFAVALLAENKEIQALARAEIDEVLKTSDGKFGMAELQNLTYLDRCIKEALRLYPPVPMVSRTLTEELKLKNYVIPSGCIVNLTIFDVHRDPNFWPEPDVFDPDRFQPDRIKNRHPYSYIPFSAGPRNCIGQKFAVLEMKAFIGLLLHNFILEPVDALSEVQMLPDLVLKSAKPVHVRFVPISE